MDVIDIAIIGGGPAGLAAALYTARARRRTVVFERGMVGGQIATTGNVENYPGFADGVDGVDGVDLAFAMQRQAEHFGAEVRSEAVTTIRREPDSFVLVTDGGELRATAVIATTGAEPNKLDVPGEAALGGRGVSYCGTCDAAFFADVPVAVVGGGDSALD